MRWIAGLVLALAATMAYADSDRMNVPANATWKEECSSCHVAYPPNLLTAGDWRQLMSGLERHFGVNAGLEMKERQEISSYLQRHAARSDRHAARSLRISDTPWFRREHREVSRQTWANPKVGSRSNCTACHVRAEHGNWSERAIRVPGRRFEDDDD
jgi:hypothetical protein